MSNTITFTNPQPPKDLPPEGKRPTGRVILIAVTSTAFLLVGVGIGAASNTSTTAAGATPATTVTKTVEVPGPVTTKTVPDPETTKTVEAAPPAPVPGKPATSITKDGIYIVGKDIEPGKYRTAEGGGYFAVLKDATAPTDDVDNILTNDNPDGQAFVTLKAGQGFETSNGMTWEKVG